MTPIRAYFPPSAIMPRGSTTTLEMAPFDPTEKVWVIVEFQQFEKSITEKVS